MGKESHTLKKGAVVQHFAKAHYLKGQLQGSKESLATTIRFVTLSCRKLSSELHQTALSGLLRYPSVPFAALQEARMGDRLDISIENYEQVVIVGIDANAKMGLEQQPNVQEEWYYPPERTWNNDHRLVDLCEQTGLILAITFNRDHRRHQLT
ncbi:hypothetical protein RB195_015948 [Necator americanus]|uniref:Uncharacterized protein n=1 Tax=Necator americanus TaxID=51031 RepID=A0ABR1E6X5_NECAM